MRVTACSAMMATLRNWHVASSQNRTAVNERAESAHDDVGQAKPPFDRSSRRRLTSHTARLFTSDSLFDRVARTVCEAGCLPRKELFEAWEVAKRVRRHFRGHAIIEACAGHALLAHLLLLLDDTSPSVTAIDSRRPRSAARIAEVMQARWPRLQGRIHYVESKLEAAAVPAAGLIVSVHACGVLTDRVISLALTQRARVAVMPCCHSLDKCDDGDLGGWLPGAVAVDVRRAERLRASGYRVRTKTIPEDITVENRLLLGEPKT